MGRPGPALRGSLVARLRSLVRGLVKRSEVDREMTEEFRHHIEMRTEDLVRRGTPRREAARQARLEFGHTDAYREQGRASRGLGPFDRLLVHWLDVKLGLRMLVKHPGLTWVAVFALAVGIPVGMAPSHLADAVEAPLPEDAANRVRGIRWWDPAATNTSPTRYRDFERWAAALTTFEAVGAFRSALYNLGADDGRAAPVAGAEVTASTFSMLGTPPLLGRTLDRADERPGAPDVVVLGHDVWVSRFGSDPGIVGRTVRVGAVSRTVVGVVPEGFYFPGREQLWLPLRPESGEEGEARRVGIVGRLATGVSAEEAQAELATLRPPEGQALLDAERRLQAEVVPYGLLFMGLPRGGMESVQGFYLVQLLALALLMVACANVGMLVFARTATRLRELAVRTALGASRARILWQIFVETLVLAVVAAAVGVAAVDWALGKVNLAALAGQAALPYWLRIDATPAAVVRALALAAVSATVAGIVPALRITGKRVQRSIQRSEARRSGVHFGGITSVLIVADVAIAVAGVAMAVALASWMTQTRASAELAGITAEEFLGVEVRMSGGESGLGVDGADLRARLASVQATLVQRLEAEPGVRAVTVAEALPRMDHTSRPIEVEGGEYGEGSGGRWVRTVRVDAGFFRALERPVLAGRGFDASDAEAAVPPIIVNTVFVEEMLGGTEPLGRRIRFSRGVPGEAPWHEIVGVVGHLGVNVVSRDGDAGVYLPAAPGTIHPFQVAIWTSADPEALAPKLRDIAREVDPALLLGAPRRLDRVHQGDWYIMLAVTAGFVLLVGVLVAMAASGIYAIVSYSISERTREIGIRTALGATRRTLILTILRRSLVQIGVGAVLGLPLAATILMDLRETESGSAPFVGVLLALVLAVAIAGLVGLFSCLVPTRRILRVEASAALRGDG